LLTIYGITLSIKLLYSTLYIWQTPLGIKVASISKRPVICWIGRSISDVHIRWINCIMARRWSNFPLVRNPPNSRVRPAINCETIIEFEDVATKGVPPDATISLIFLTQLSSIALYFKMLLAKSWIFLDVQLFLLMWKKTNKYTLNFLLWNLTPRK